MPESEVPAVGAARGLRDQRQDFGTLSRAERQLAKYRRALLGNAVPAPDEREIEVRASFLRALLLGEVESEDRRGRLELKGVIVVGTLDLSGCSVECQFSLEECLCDRIDLNFAKLQSVSLQGTHFTGNWFEKRLLPLADLSARRVEIAGDFDLQEVSAPCGFDLIDARVTGSLVCSGAVIGTAGEHWKRAEVLQTEYAVMHTPFVGGRGIFADRIDVGGNLHFQRVTIHGQARLSGARVQRSIFCDHAEFGNDGGTSLNLARANIENDFCAEHFHSRGQMNFLSAAVGGSIRLGPGKLVNPEVIAFAADKITIGEDICIEKTMIEGGVSLEDAQVSGDLDLAPREIECSNGRALSAKGLRLGGNLSMRNVYKGEIFLSSVKITGDAEFGSGLVANSGGLAMSLERAEVLGQFSMNPGFWVYGTLNLSDASLGGLVDESLPCPRDLGSLEIDGCAYRNLLGARQTVEKHLSWIARAERKVSFVDVEDDQEKKTHDPANQQDDVDAPQVDNSTKAQNRRPAAHGRNTSDREQAKRKVIETTALRLQPYHQLATVLQGMGREEDAKRVLATRERRIRNAEFKEMPRWRQPFHWLFTQLLKMVGFGYRLEYALLPSFTVVVAGWFICSFAWENELILRNAQTSPGDTAIATADNDTATGINAEPSEIENSSTPQVEFVALAYSFETFLPAFSLGQVEAFSADMSVTRGYWLQIYLWIQGLSGWLIGGSAVAGVLRRFNR